MNISQISLDHSGRNQDTYGTIKDVYAGKQSLIEHGPRNKQLISSTTNEVTLSLLNDDLDENRFMLHVQGTYKASCFCLFSN